MRGRGQQGEADMDTVVVVPQKRSEDADLRGSAAETRVLDALVADVRAGRGRSLALHGESGTGKSRLLDHLEERGGGMRILRVNGVAGETELPFAAVQRLCAPLHGKLGHLPPTYRDALAVVLGLRDGPVPSPVHVGTAVAGLLARVGGAGAMMCLLDDAHLMDRASRTSLAVAARRCGGRTAFVFALPDAARFGELRRFERLTVLGLSAPEAHALLATRLHAPLDPRVRDRMVAEARGNPRALLDAARSIGPTEMAFCTPDEPRLSLSADWETALNTALHGLSAPARDLLVLAAAEPFGESVTVLRAAERLGIGRDAVDEIEATGLLALTPHVRFATPLLRTATYARAAVAQRRRIHAALAGGMPTEEAPERRAWHRGQAAVTLDEAVAAQLQDAAELTDGLAAGATTAALWELAASLTPDRQTRALRLLAGARVRHRTGSLRQALHLLADVHTAPLPALERAQAAVLLAQTRYGVHRDTAAVRSLNEAARHAAVSGHRHIRDVSALDALTAQIFAGRLHPPQEAVAGAAGMRTESYGTQLPETRALLLQALHTRTRHGYGPAVPLLRRAVDAHLAAGLPSQPHPDTNGNWLLCHAAVDVWDAAAWETIAEWTVAAARATGATSVLPAALVHQAFADLHRGRLDVAAARVSEAEAISATIGAVSPGHAVLTLTAWRGDRDRTEALAAACRRDAEARGEGRLLSTVEYAQAVLHNALGDYARAFELTGTAMALDEPAFRPWLLPERLEAAVRTGHVQEAEAVAERLATCARLTDTDWARGIHLRALALLADDTRADALYRCSAERLDVAGAELQAARTRLLWGEWLRRNSRTVLARIPLRAAHETFLGAGARAFAERAAGELAAAGFLPESGVSGTRAALTAQEERIARAVAGGATTKEVATALVLSPRTIDAHLRSIFRKLGVSSRRQLREASVLPPEELRSRVEITGRRASSPPRRREGSAPGHAGTA